MGFLTTIGNAIGETLKPILVEKADELLTEVTNVIKAEIREHIPVIIEAVVKAVATTGIELAANAGDKVTDLIPGHLDDQFIDPIVGNLVAEFRRRLGF